MTMLLENNPYPQDVRVRNEAMTLARAGYDVEVVAPRVGDQPFRALVDGVRVTRFRVPQARPTVSGYLAEYAIAHLQLLARGALALWRGADVIHVHNPPDTLFALSWLTRALGRRFVFDHHDSAPELVREKFGSRRLEGVLRATQRASARCADLVVASNATQRDLLVGRGGTSADRAVVVRNGPRADTIAASEDVGRTRADRPLLVFLGELAVHDGVLELPDVLSRVVRDHGVDAHLRIIGDGPSRAALQARVASLGLEDRVEMTGWQPHALVPALLRDADVCLDPAPCSPLNHTCTMIKIGEYLAAARPVVAYALKETGLTLGSAGVTVTCGDRPGFERAIAELCADARRRRALSVAAAERAADLVWEHSAQVLLAAYGETLDREPVSYAPRAARSRAGRPRRFTPRTR